MLPGVVDGPAVDRHLPRQVDLAEEPPQRRVRRRVQRRHVPQPYGPLGALDVPLGLDEVPRVADDFTVPLRDHAPQRRGPLALALRVQQRQLLPPGPPRQHPRPPGHQPRVHRLALVPDGGGLGVAQAYVVRARRHREPDAVGVDLGGRGHRRDAVPEAAVDLRLGGRQDGQRFAPGPYVVQLPAHHRPQDAPPPMRGGDTDHRDAGRGHGGAAGHGEPEAEGARRPHARVPVPDAEGAVELGEPLPQLTFLGRLRDAAEGVDKVVVPGVPLVLAQYPQLGRPGRCVSRNCPHGPCLPAHCGTSQGISAGRLHEGLR